MKNFKNPWAAEDSRWYALNSNTYPLESEKRRFVDDIRSVEIVITADKVGDAHVRSYPDYSKGKKFKVPLYKIIVKGNTAAGLNVQETFSAIRFGVQLNKAKNIGPRVVRLADAQTHVLKWVDYLSGSWQVYGDFLIHDGPENPADPSSQGWGALGCIEITGMNQWQKFNATIKEYSGSISYREISEASKLKAVYQRVTQHPPLIEV